ncbi:hypothetical protein DXA38_16955 [[Clostridium] innocuum]|uniref:Uncharacterized protein n=1 Tax=Clostridium innocuum TaxID=1522 RepID=A0A3E2VNN8_CLOIN|nr:hypothetical protein DXA38_16955 [[Clostridium] innocuum]RHV61451.1 hypothetical protein DXB22_17380 [Clostridiaceae bacterium OM02-2AC]
MLLLAEKAQDSDNCNQQYAQKQDPSVCIMKHYGKESVLDTARRNICNCIKGNEAIRLRRKIET